MPAPRNPQKSVVRTAAGLTASRRGLATVTSSRGALTGQIDPGASMLPLAPRNLRVLTMDVAEWLRTLGLGRYEAAFRENDVSAGLLSKLTEGDLKDLGITSVGHRRLLLEAIAAL